MTKYYWLGPLILASALLASTTAAMAQEQVSAKSHAPHATRAQQQDTEDAPAFDDDGGRVFLITRGRSKELANLEFHGGDVINQPRQVSIFLGNGWSHADNRSREASLSEALAGLEGSVEGTELNRHGVSKAAQPALQYEELWPLAQEGDPNLVISDLQIQRVLSDLIESREIVRPDEKVVFAVFLSPELRSTIGESLGRKHYVAYHNFFHIEGGQVTYMVMPFEPNKKAARSVATQALVRAILNPSGNGWF
jgi:hypothetical protein